MKIQTASDLGALVRDRRGIRGLSQQALALRAGVSVRWLKAFEAGKSTAEIGLVLRTLGALDLTLSVIDAPGPSGLDLDDVLARFDQDPA
jgi:HTH-type transcriptional regulator / antitoxin HipB